MTLDSRTARCESGGIGRRTRLRIWRVKPWGFESPLSHQNISAPTLDKQRVPGSPEWRIPRVSELSGQLGIMITSPFPLPEEFNAASYFVDRHISEDRGENVAIECADRQVTYRELFESVNRVGNALRKLGVRIEERVFLLLLDTPEFAASFFGAIKIGAVPVPVNTLLKPADYEFLLNNSRARVAIASDSLSPLLQAIPAQNLRYLETIIVADDATRGGATRGEAERGTAPR